jgi:hypothetical protein
MCAVFLSACSKKEGEIEPVIKEYFEKTKNLSLDQWYSETATSTLWGSFFLNLIPALHLITVWIDTIMVIETSKDLALGNGTIIAKQYSCPTLVTEEDYEIIQAMWVETLPVSELQAAYNMKHLSMSANPHDRYLALKLVKKNLAKKVGFKVAMKIFGKYTVKVIMKKFAGFIPLVGGIVAVTINRSMFFSPIDENSKIYFKIKAEAMC